jgi:hypothetical protein
MPPFLLAVALACLLGACVTRPDNPHRVVRMDRAVLSGDVIPDSGAPPSKYLRDSPALSSTATLPRLSRTSDTTGRSSQIDALMTPNATLSPGAANPGGAHPLVGIVPGGGAWP